MSTESDSSSWSLYFANQLNHDSMLFDERTYMERLDRLSPILFGDSIDIEIIQSLIDGVNISNLLLKDEIGLQEQLSKKPTPTLTIISITQAHSLSPFNITESSMCQIFSTYQIPPGFLDIVCGFGDKAASADEGSASGVYSNFNGTSHDIFYQFWYVEQNHRKHGDPWSVRQTGVYHRFSSPHPLSTTAAAAATAEENLWLLLHPMPNSKAQTRLDAAMTSINAKDIALDPLRPHILIMSSYIDNWRWYLHDIKRQYLDLEDTLMTSELRENHGLNFDSLQTLSHLASKLIPVPNMLQSLISTIQSIQAMNNAVDSAKDAPKLAETAYHLASCSSRLQSYVATADVLQKRIQNLKRFLADGLSLQNQDISAEANKSLVKLTEDTVEDSATVRTITLVTLIYLPSSFISSLFGMNLFSFNTNTTAFDISNQFWIYIAAIIPLTALTIGYWKYRIWRKSKEKQQREDRKRSLV